jgi:succinate-semialdehyde dehydrogenase/glutarate-semialdehyde dehydrogenase
VGKPVLEEGDVIDRDSEKRVVDSAPKQLLIGGRWQDAASGKKLAVDDPSTEEVLTEVADADATDAKRALDAAVEAQREWARTPPRDRGEILRRSYEMLNEQAEDLALLMTLEMGKPLAESKGEIVYAADFFRWFAEEAVRIPGDYTVSANGQGRTMVMRQPVGPCLLITPWNFPMAMGTRKIGPAVAAGCTMVIKPAGATPLSMLALARIMEDAGLPPGVLNVITTSSSSATTSPLIEDPRLRKVSFTGSTEVGAKLMEQASKNVMRVSMELGGNAPFIVFDDADLDAAVEGAMLAKMRNLGESCVAANRFFVAESIVDDFSSRLADRMGALKIGRGTEPDVTVGPLINEDQRSKVAELVDDAVGKGAKCLVGGGKVGERGYFYEPTVLSGITDDADVLREEIFGPVAPIRSFGDEAEAVEWANDTEYGLVAYVFTRDMKRALRVVEDLETGMVGVNKGLVSNPAAPFGGIKASGFGREGGREGIHEYLEVKNVAIDL